MIQFRRGAAEAAFWGIVALMVAAFIASLLFEAYRNPDSVIIAVGVVAVAAGFLGLALLVGELLIRFTEGRSLGGEGQ